MSRRLIDDPDAVSVLAARTADATGIPAAHVEKDFWVTEVLRGVAAAAAEWDVEVWFKGGTSLSKVFGMIDRFSEDVDMLVVLPPGSVGAQDRVLRGLVEGAHLATGIDAVVDEYANRVVGQLLWPGRPHPSLRDCIDLVQRYADIL